MPVPDGTRFKTGLSTTHPWWRIQGQWFHDDANECVVGAALAARNPDAFAIGKQMQVTPSVETNATETNAQWPLMVTGIVSTGGSEDDAVIVPLSFLQKISGREGQFRQLFVSALTKPADAFSERNPDTMTPEEHDRWFCSPYISSISFQIKQVLPGTDVRTIRRVADTEGRILTRVSTLLWIVTIAALIAAALAVAATSATTVLERRGEIGILKAIGATNAIVAGMFLAEQLAACDRRRLVRLHDRSRTGVGARREHFRQSGIASVGALARDSRDCLHRRSPRKLDSFAAGGAFRSRADPARRMMFGRLLWKLLRGSSGRLAVAMIGAHQRRGRDFRAAQSRARYRP